MMTKIRMRIQNYLLKKNYVVLNYNKAKKGKNFELIREVLKRSQLKGSEAYQLLTLVRDICKKRKGNLAEVGVFRGGTAKLICEVKGSNNLYLFDTFEGLPKPSEADKESKFEEGEFKETSLEEVNKYLSKYSNFSLIKGLFPKSVPKYLFKKKFIFVHLDVDLYESTLESLKFFYPRMESGGIIISHDYSTHNGVKQAFDEYFKNKPELVIELPESQGLVVKK